MQIKIVENYIELSEQAAQIVADTVKEKQKCVIGFPTGGTPVGMYQQLVDLFKKGELDFSGVSTFNLDEYIGLSQDHEQSYYQFMYKNLFAHVNLDPKNTHIPRGDVQDLEQECVRYEEQIDASGQMDLLVIGIGTNGHIGFNEPGSDPNSATSIVDLAESTIQSNSIYFSSLDEVPKQAVTMGLGTILKKSKRILLLASGKSKAEIMNKLLSTEEVSKEIPASFLKQHPNVTILMDREAAELYSAGE